MAFVSWLDGEGSAAVPSGFYSIVTRCVKARTTPCPASSVEALGLLLHHRNLTSINTVSCFPVTRKEYNVQASV